MFKTHVEQLINTIKDLENSLTVNKKTKHLSDENVKQMQETITYLAKGIVSYYEDQKAVMVPDMGMPMPTEEEDEN